MMDAAGAIAQEWDVTTIASAAYADIAKAQRSFPKVGLKYLEVADQISVAEIVIWEPLASHVRNAVKTSVDNVPLRRYLCKLYVANVLWPPDWVGDRKINILFGFTFAFKFSFADVSL